MRRSHINSRHVLSPVSPSSCGHLFFIIVLVISSLQLVFEAKLIVGSENIPNEQPSVAARPAATNLNVTQKTNTDQNTKDNYNIPVNIQFQPAHYLHDKNYIATNTNLTAKAEILDDKFKNLTIEYQWSVKEKSIVNSTNASEIVYSFSSPDEDEFLQLHVVHNPNATGFIKKNLVIRDPVTVQDPQGKLFLERGELLDIKLNFTTGTKPINYCLKFCTNLQRNFGEGDECTECKPDMETTGNQVAIVEYLRNVGNYTLVLVADNVASHVAKRYLVKITDTIRPKTIPFVPIVSSILAVIIVLSGLALHMRFKKTLVTETADFDFIRHDYNEDEDFWDDEEYTFIQRVRYLFFGIDRDYDTSVSDSMLSGAGSRI